MSHCLRFRAQNGAGAWRGVTTFWGLSSSLAVPRSPGASGRLCGWRRGAAFFVLLLRFSRAEQHLGGWVPHAHTRSQLQCFRQQHGLPHHLGRGLENSGHGMKPLVRILALPVPRVQALQRYAGAASPQLTQQLGLPLPAAGPLGTRP